MATLKDKAKSRSNTAAKKTASSNRGSSKEGMVVDNSPTQPAPPIVSQGAFDAPPPLPPALAYIRKFATIPSLRKGDE